MARIRTVKPTFWTDEKIGLLSRAARLTFLGLVSAMADDEGRLVGSSRIVRGAIYPFDDDITSAEIDGLLAELAAAGRIVRYRRNGEEFIAIRNWHKHQKIDRPSPSILPAPPEAFDADSSNVRRPDPAVVEGSVGEGKREDPSSSSSAARARAPDRDAAFAVMVAAWPKLADALPPLGGRDVLLELAKWAPDKRSYLGECAAALEGMHGYVCTPAELRVGITDWLSNDERPNARKFRNYLRGAINRGGPGPPTSESGGARRRAPPAPQPPASTTYGQLFTPGRNRHHEPT